MKMFKRLVFSLLFIAILATVLSLLVTRRAEVKVVKGFTYGAPTAQVASTTPGTFTNVYYGFPSTYKHIQTFRPDGDVFSESSVVVQDWGWLYVISNIVFWSGLFVALLSPFTIFYRPKAHQPEALITQNEVKSTDSEVQSPVKSAEK
ncbi:hypothetical protein KDA06_02455 [Candidatus Saccharibacteria bacterium]|jgi:hypothetical protein|nr:hypothetical protein [Candidatus Saccharibacteria bacterium]HPR09656.1 hypothetical protein [Candidatus Saccharibacteria bacterium]